jgi:MoaA/NifB/PqqE/SkfB family radical SAM enzyme
MSEIIFMPDEVCYMNDKNYIRTIRDVVDMSGSMGSFRPNIKDILQYHMNKFRKIIKTNKPFLPNEAVECFLENPLVFVKDLYAGKTCPRLSDKFWLFLNDNL